MVAVVGHPRAVLEGHPTAEVDGHPTAEVEAATPVEAVVVESLLTTWTGSETWVSIRTYSPSSSGLDKVSVMSRRRSRGCRRRCTRNSNTSDLRPASSPRNGGR